jgi:MtaA/CmuA family methyltransferase
MTTSRELVETALRREPVERIPFFPPFQGYWALKNENITTMDSINNPELSAGAQIKNTEPCCLDAVEVLWDWLFPVEALGCQVKIPEYGTIATTKNVVNEPGDIDKLELPDLDKFYRYSSAKKAAEIISEKLGKDHYLTASMPGPFTLAGELRGVDSMLLDSLMNPTFVDDLLKKATELDQEAIEYVCGWDIDAVLVCDPTTSGDLMSPEDFVRFSKARLKEAGDTVRKSGKDFIVHMCGDTSDRLKDIADTGCKAFSCDKQVDMGQAVSLMKDRMAMIGNIDPSGIIFAGTPDDVRRETEKLMKAGGNTGFLVGAGCDIPVGSKFECVKAIGDALKGI